MTQPNQTPFPPQGDIRAIASVGAAFLVLCIAWMSVLPLFAGPDEPANFIKSAAVVRGEMVGRGIEASSTTSFWSTYVEINSQFGVAQQVPWCFVGQPQTAACDKPISTLTPVEESRTDMGRYPALGFLPAGIGTLIGPSDNGARAARFTAALVCSALLVMAAELLRRRQRSIVPLLVAISPGVLFLSSVSSPSGFEISAAIAAWTAVWMAISEGWRQRSTIAVFIAAASMLVIARPAGIVTVGVMVALGCIANGCALVSSMISSWKRFLWLLAALVTSGGWYFTVYDSNFGVRLEIEARVDDLSTIASRSLVDLPRLIGESIGNFGWLDTPSPTIVVWGFVAAAAALTWRAVTDADRRKRAAIALSIFVVPIWHIALNANYQDLLGTFGAQGRHLTPFIVGIPLAATMRRTARTSELGAITFFVAAHAWCVLVALRRYSLGAGGDDLLGFVRNPVWTPPLGMTATLVVVGTTHIFALFALRSYAGRMER
jgi:hypothetical protein